MKAIILAAGQGKRLKQYTNGLPKCLLPLGNETILSREIRLLKEAGLNEADIFVVGGYRYETLMDVSPNLIINEEYDIKDNSHSLALALKHIGHEDVLILDADLCFEKTLIDSIVKHPEPNVVLSKLSKDLHESTGIVTSEVGRVIAIGKQYENTGFVYISIFKIGGEVVAEFITELIKERSSRTWYTLAITELCKKYDFYNVTTNEKWHEIDVIEDYIETKQLFGLE